MRRDVRIRASVVVRVLLTVGVWCAVCAPAPPARAVTTAGKFSIDVTPNTTMQYATYALTSFRVQNKETVTGYRLTFPAGTDASLATSPGNTVTVSPDGRTVSVLLGTAVDGPVSMPITLGNVRNPAAAAPDYSIPSVTFTRQGTTDETVDISGTTYAIVPAPYLSMTITTPDSGQVVDFGAIDPGIAVATKQVTVAVISSAAYTITRTTGGDSALLGLTITGTATGAKPLGTDTFIDDYVLAPPWTTDPEVPLVATVTYTVTQ